MQQYIRMVKHQKRIFFMKIIATILFYLIGLFQAQKKITFNDGEILGNVAFGDGILDECHSARKTIKN